MPSLEFQKFLEVFDREGVEFILVGGIAGIGHGMNCLTEDLDICYRRSNANYTALVRALRPAKPQLRVPSGTLPFLFDERTLKNGLNFTLESEWGAVDLLGEIQGIGNYETLLPRVVKMVFFDFTVNALSLEDLIKAKQAAGRTKDKLHLLELDAIQKIQKERE